MFKHILLATDGSASSEHAAQLAVNLARIHGARLTALYVADPYPYIGIGEMNPAGLCGSSPGSPSENGYCDFSPSSARFRPEPVSACQRSRSLPLS